MITKEMMYKKLQEVQDGHSAGTNMGIQKAKELVEYLSDDLCPDDLYSLEDSVHIIWNKRLPYYPVIINVVCYPNDYVVTINLLLEQGVYSERELKFHTSMVRPVLSLIRSYVE